MVRPNTAPTAASLKAITSVTRGGLQDAAGLASRRKAYEGPQRALISVRMALSWATKNENALEPSGVGDKGHARRARCL